MLIDPNVQNPTTIALTSSQLFTLTVTDIVSGCNDTDDVLVSVTGGALTVDVNANPNPSCAGNLVQLMAITGGGTGNYTYVWTSNPVGFNSTIPNPAVYPTISTTYIVVVNDGFNTVSDSVLVVVNPLPIMPDTPVGPDTVDLKSITSSVYTTNSAATGDSLVWEIAPTSTGVITWLANTATVIWNPNYLGLAYIKVKAINNCGSSSWSPEKITFVDNTTGIIQYEAISIVLYPNPNQGIFFIKSSENISKIIIFEQIGKAIAEVQNPDENFKYDYSELPVGVYFVRIMGEKFNVVRKIIITK